MDWGGGEGRGRRRESGVRVENIGHCWMRMEI
jgi:hypothetical protein